MDFFLRQKQLHQVARPHTSTLITTHLLDKLDQRLCANSAKSLAMRAVAKPVEYCSNSAGLRSTKARSMGGLGGSSAVQTAPGSGTLPADVPAARKRQRGWRRRRGAERLEEARRKTEAERRSSERRASEEKSSP